MRRILTLGGDRLIEDYLPGMLVDGRNTVSSSLVEVAAWDSLSFVVGAADCELSLVATCSTDCGGSGTGFRMLFMFIVAQVHQGPESVVQ